jgi:HSP20 family protein
MLWQDLERFGSRWDPWREFDNMQRTFTRWTTPSSVEFPAVNVWVSADNAFVTSEIPGVDPDSIEISVVGKSVTIRGARKPDMLKEGEAYHRRERWEGQFSKTLEMPFTIDSSKVEAKSARGILRISLPRAEADKPRKIAVKSF